MNELVLDTLKRIDIVTYHLIKSVTSSKTLYNYRLNDIIKVKLFSLILKSVSKEDSRKLKEIK